LRGIVSNDGHQTRIHDGNRAFDRYLPKELRHRYATFADDVAAGADTLEELFDLLKAIVICFQEAGIQVKASKMIFGVTEVSFHNYTMSKDQTRPKDENLDPIKNCVELCHPRKRDQCQGFPGLHTTNGTLLSMLRFSSGAAARVNQR
jgi:hypothetical protein